MGAAVECGGGGGGGGEFGEVWVGEGVAVLVGGVGLGIDFGRGGDGRWVGLNVLTRAYVCVFAIGLCKDTLLSN